MARGEILPIQHAARALGVPDDQLRRLTEQGAIPGAINRDGEWLIPTMSLMSIARQQGWTLDLAALSHQFDSESPTRYSGDALAAQAAVLLAKTQATAARVESRDLLRRLREATAAAATDRAARLEAVEALAKSERELEKIRRSHAVAEAKVAELRTQLGGDNPQFHFMVDRIKNLEQERQRLSRSLGWLGRLRYKRLLERDLSRPERTEATDPGPVPLPSPSLSPSLSRATASRPPAVFATGTGAPPKPKPKTDNFYLPDDVDQPPPPAPSIPPVPIRSASTVVVTDHVGADPRSPGIVDPSSGHTAVPRTPDGRFDRSALGTVRSTNPLAAR